MRECHYIQWDGSEQGFTVSYVWWIPSNFALLGPAVNTLVCALWIEYRFEVTSGVLFVQGTLCFSSHGQSAKDKFFFLFFLSIRVNQILKKPTYPAEKNRSPTTSGNLQTTVESMWVQRLCTLSRSAVFRTQWTGSRTECTALFPTGSQICNTVPQILHCNTNRNKSSS